MYRIEIGCPFLWASKGKEHQFIAKALYFSLVVLSHEILSNSAKNKALEVRDFVKSAALSIWRGARERLNYGVLAGCGRNSFRKEILRPTMQELPRNF